MADAITDPVFREEIDLPKADEDFIRACRAVGHSVDDLAYTPEFDELYQRYEAQGHNEERHEVFR